MCIILYIDIMHLVNFCLDHVKNILILVHFFCHLFLILLLFLLYYLLGSANWLLKNLLNVDLSSYILKLPSQ